MMNDFTHISIKLATALLLQQGRISISDIRALPFVENRHVVNAIITSLNSAYDLECYLARNPITERWEDVFRFRRRLSAEEAVAFNRERFSA